MVAATGSFAARLAASIASTRSMLCLGLDPDRVGSAAEAEQHCLALLDATLGEVCAVKPNLAFFERFGSAGYAVLERLRGRVPADRMLILDGKRGDIANTAAAYADALFDVLGADAVTVNPLMGHDSVEPFLARAGRGAFLLTRTSNPGAADFMLRSAGPAGETLAELIVETALGWDTRGGSIGFVVGATDPRAVAAVRRLAPEAPLLLPGVGAQGGALEATVAAARSAGTGCAVIPVSRGVASAPAGPAAAARELRERIAAALGAA